MDKDIKAFGDFWEKREIHHTAKNWAISSFHLGMEIEKQKHTDSEMIRIHRDKLLSFVQSVGGWMCPKCGTYSNKGFVCHGCCYDPTDT